MYSKAVPIRKWAFIWLGLLLVFALMGACTAESAPAPTEAPAPEIQSATSGDGSPVTALRYSPDGQTLISGHENGAVHLRDAGGASMTTLAGHAAAVVAVAASPDGQLVASIGVDKRTLLQASDGSGVNELDVALARANTVDFSPDGEQLAVGFWEKLELWPLADLDAGPALVADLEPSMSMAWFMPDGESLMVAMSNVGLARSALLRVDPADSSVVQTLHPSAPATLLIASPDSVQMATATAENVQLWCVTCDTAVKTLPIADVKAVSFGPDGETLLTLQPGVVTVWDLGDDEPLYTAEVAADGELAAAFSPMGDALAIGQPDGTVEIVALDGE